MPGLTKIRRYGGPFLGDLFCSGSDPRPVPLRSFAFVLFNFFRFESATERGKLGAGPKLEKHSPKIIFFVVLEVERHVLSYWVGTQSVPCRSAC